MAKIITRLTTIEITIRIATATTITTGAIATTK